MYSKTENERKENIMLLCQLRTSNLGGNRPKTKRQTPSIGKCEWRMRVNWLAIMDEGKAFSSWYHLQNWRVHWLHSLKSHARNFDIQLSAVTLVGNYHLPNWLVFHICMRHLHLLYCHVSQWTLAQPCKSKIARWNFQFVLYNTSTSPEKTKSSTYSFMNQH